MTNPDILQLLRLNSDMARRVADLERGPKTIDLGLRHKSPVTPVQLAAYVSEGTYTGYVYGNGTDATATETGATIRVLLLATGTNLVSLGATGPYLAWRQRWAGVEYWTIQPPIWM